jgi:hypothetical protein
VVSSCDCCTLRYDVQSIYSKIATVANQQRYVNSTVGRTVLCPNRRHFASTYKCFGMLPYRILIFDVFGTFSYSSLSFLIPFLLAFHQHRIRAAIGSSTMLVRVFVNIRVILLAKGTHFDINGMDIYE